MDDFKRGFNIQRKLRGPAAGDPLHPGARSSAATNQESRRGGKKVGFRCTFRRLDSERPLRQPAPGGGLGRGAGRLGVHSRRSSVVQAPPTCKPSPWATRPTRPEGPQAKQGGREGGRLPAFNTRPRSRSKLLRHLRLAPARKPSVPALGGTDRVAASCSVPAKSSSGPIASLATPPDPGPRGASARAGRLFTGFRKYD